VQQPTRQREERGFIDNNGLLPELLGLEEIGFGLTGAAWNGGNRVWLDCNGLEWKKLVLA
jgi:hypothetical protein